MTEVVVVVLSFSLFQDVWVFLVKCGRFLRSLSIDITFASVCIFQSFYLCYRLLHSVYLFAFVCLFLCICSSFLCLHLSCVCVCVFRFLLLSFVCLCALKRVSFVRYDKVKVNELSSFVKAWWVSERFISFSSLLSLIGERKKRVCW